MVHFPSPNINVTAQGPTRHQQAGNEAFICEHGVRADILQLLYSFLRRLTPAPPFTMSSPGVGPAPPRPTASSPEDVKMPYILTTIGDKTSYLLSFGRHVSGELDPDDDTFERCRWPRPIFVLLKLQGLIERTAEDKVRQGRRPRRIDHGAIEVVAKGNAPQGKRPCYGIDRLIEVIPERDLFEAVREPATTRSEPFEGRHK